MRTKTILNVIAGITHLRALLQNATQATFNGQEVCLVPASTRDDIVKALAMYENALSDELAITVPTVPLT